MAFVDYESWYISLLKNFGLKPDIKAWFEDLSTRVYLTEAVFFADFSHKSLADEIRRIRPYSNKIIDTRSPNGVEKDYTDFIILDNIYQKALASQDRRIHHRAPARAQGRPADGLPVRRLGQGGAKPLRRGISGGKAKKRRDRPEKYQKAIAIAAKMWYDKY